MVYLINLLKKNKGRNRDLLVSQMDSYHEMKEELKIHQKRLNKANEKSIKLDNNSNEVKDRYEEFTIDLYNNYAIDDETFNDIINNKDKRKDDFER